MNNLWLEKTGFVVLTLVLLAIIIIMVSVFWPAQTPTTEINPSLTNVAV